MVSRVLTQKGKSRKMGPQGFFPHPCIQMNDILVCWNGFALVSVPTWFVCWTSTTQLLLYFGCVYICIYLYIWSPIFVAKLPSLIALSSPHQKSGSTQLPPGQCHARLRSAPPPFVLLDAVASWQDGVKRPERQTGDLWKKIAIIRRGYTVCLYVCLSVCLSACMACMHAFMFV